MIIIAGIIGSGKSSLTEILAQEFQVKPFYEPVSDNPVLPLFYQGNELAAKKRAAGDKNATNPYTYLLQTFFLNRRFKMIKEASKYTNSILDRSIHEDAMFMKMNTDLGNATAIEYQVYQELLTHMLNELDDSIVAKQQNLTIIIKVSYHTMLRRIKKRGRSFEQVENDPSLKEYYHNLLKYYDDWIATYHDTPTLVIDGDRYDFVGNEIDRQYVVKQIKDKLAALKEQN